MEEQHKAGKVWERSLLLSGLTWGRWSPTANSSAMVKRRSLESLESGIAVERLTLAEWDDAFNWSFLSQL